MSLLCLIAIMSCNFTNQKNDNLSVIDIEYNPNEQSFSAVMAQGQFLDNQKAAQFILDNVGKTANEAVNIPTPNGFPARIIMPDGTLKAATHIRLVPGSGGVKTAYPLIP